MEWKFEKSGLDGQCELYGVNIFDYDWQSTGETAWVDDPRRLWLSKYWMWYGDGV